MGRTGRPKGSENKSKLVFLPLEQLNQAFNPNWKIPVSREWAEAIFNIPEEGEEPEEEEKLPMTVHSFSNEEDEDD